MERFDVYHNQFIIFNHSHISLRKVFVNNAEFKSNNLKVCAINFPSNEIDFQIYVAMHDLTAFAIVTKRDHVHQRVHTTNSCAFRTPMLPIAKTPPRFREIETLVSLYLSRKQGVRGKGRKRGRGKERREWPWFPSRNKTYYCDFTDWKFIKGKRKKKKRKNREIAMTANKKIHIITYILYIYHYY